MAKSKDNSSKKFSTHNHEDCACDCGHNHNEEHCDCDNKQIQHTYKMCVLEEDKLCVHCGACDMCDLDPNKVCDNCGKCLDQYATNDKGFVEIPVDKIIMGESEDDELESLIKLYGLDDDE